MDINAHIKRFEKLKGNRVNFDSMWQECADYCIPQKATITDLRAEGEKIKTDIYDSTALESIPIAAAGLHSYMTNPSSLWFDLEMRDKQFKDDTKVKDWLSECVGICFDYLNDSNLNSVLSEFYTDFTVFGNPCLYQEEILSEKLFSFSSRPISEVYFLTNEQGEIDTVYRYFTYTARQAMMKWGVDKVAQDVRDSMEELRDPEKSRSYLHIVTPRETRDTRKMDNKNMAYGSVYADYKEKKQLSEGGYREFPFFIPRFYKVSDSDYAYSPATIGLADIKMLNKMSQDILEAAAKTLHPPVIIPHDGFFLPFKTSPKAINFKKTTNPNAEKIETLQLNREIGISLEMLNQRRQSIARIFFVDLFLMLSNLPDKQRTATEIAERVNERMLILGPALGRLMEALSNLVIRTFNILARNGVLPEPPQQIQGKEFKVKFISPLAKAQRAAEAKSVGDMLMAVQAMAATKPDVVDNVDFDKATRKFGDIFNTSEILRSDQDVQAIRELRQQQQQEQMQLAAVPEGAKALKDAAQAEAALKGGEK